MGRYRELVRALIYYSNCSNRSRPVSMNPVLGDTSLLKHEYQVLEYILEFEEENRILSDISRDVGIQPCTVTKVTRRLLSLGLIERFHIKGNRKNIVLKPTQKGRAVYEAYCTRDISKLFAPFFESLESFTDAELDTIMHAIQTMNRKWDDFGDTLEKIDSASV